MNGLKLLEIAICAFCFIILALSVILMWIGQHHSTPVPDDYKSTTKINSYIEGYDNSLVAIGMHEFKHNNITEQGYIFKPHSENTILYKDMVPE